MLPTRVISKGIFVNKPKMRVNGFNRVKPERAQESYAPLAAVGVPSKQSKVPLRKKQDLHI